MSDRQEIGVGNFLLFLISLTLELKFFIKIFNRVLHDGQQIDLIFLKLFNQKSLYQRSFLK